MKICFENSIGDISHSHVQWIQETMKNLDTIFITIFNLKIGQWIDEIHKAVKHLPVSVVVISL